jgi:putative flippase GtrA
MTAGPRRLGALLSGARFGRFVSVGAMGAILDLSVLVVLTEVFGVLPEVATLAGIESAILLMFAINERWTFAESGAPGRRPLLRRLLRSHGVRAVGSLTQFVVFVVLYRYGGVAISVSGIDAWLVVAKVGAIGIAVVVNYTFESLFTWRVHEG